MNDTTADLKLADLAGFTHVWSPAAVDAEAAPVLLLLHGTGGDEFDLLELGRMLSPSSSLLSPRGRVLEGQMNRFFRRIGEGIFDEADIRRRAGELAEFVITASSEYGFDMSRLVGVGFSNGANIGAALLLLHPGLIRRAVFLSPMTPLLPDTAPDLSTTSIFIGAGRMDPISPPAEADKLARLFQRYRADVDLQYHSSGHTITAPEIESAANWLRAHSA